MSWEEMYTCEVVPEQLSESVDIQAIASGHVETVCQLERKYEDDSIVGNEAKRKINYREEEISDCGCIYG